MKKMRSILGIALLSLIFSCHSGKHTQTTTDTTVSTTSVSDSTTVKHIRYNVNSPQGQKALTAMEAALKIMRNMDCSQTTSWYYQGAMHWVPDSIPVNPLCTSYTKPSDKKANWDNCTHFKKGIEINFLIWHRLYIYNFEKIIRSISHDESFALPYWAYTDTTNVTANRTLNAMLRNPKSSLYTASRFKDLNNGAPLSGDIIPALDLTKLNQNTDLYLYSKQIDAAPHGAMHDYIGAGNNANYMIYNEIYQKVYNGGLMANVPSAGFDPVFWLHHSNIDRIWQQWTNSPNGKKITVEDLKAHPINYHFYNEKGQEVIYTPEQIVKIIYNLDYDFDDTKLNQGGALLKAKATPSVFLSTNITADTIAEKNVMQNVTGKALTFSVANKHQEKLQLFASKNSAGVHKTVIVKLTVSVTKEPRGIYQVYINLPKGATPDTKGNYFAGFMTFFGATHPMSMPGMDMNEQEATFYFDLTDEFAQTNALSKPNFDISILDKSGKGLGNFTIKEVSIVVK